MRQLLAEASPHVALKPAWLRTIQLLRRARRSGHSTRLHSRAAVDQFLAMEATETMDAEAIKSALREALVAKDDTSGMEHALCVDRLAGASLHNVETGDVGVRLSKTPDWMTDEMVTQWLGPSSTWQTVRARQAAAFLHHIDGLNIGGSTVRVEIETGSDHGLPTVPRSKRKRARKRGITPWLPFIDDGGRISATPQTIALRQGLYMRKLGRPVVDPFCGAGANAIGAALSGCEVRASDVSATRVALAKRNAQHFGVADKIDFAVCDAKYVIEHIVSWDITLFLDPPWGGADWDREDMTYTSLFGGWPIVQASVLRARSVMLKLPRTFQVDSLPARKSAWRITLGIHSHDDHPADRIRLLTATSTDV